MEKKHIFLAFAFFYKELYNQPAPSYNERNMSLCEDFIQMLIKRYQYLDVLGIDYLWHYFVFHFEYWKKLDIKNNKKIDLSYVIGKRAFDRYLQRDTEFDWQIENNTRTYSKKEFEEKVNLQQQQQQEEDKYDPDELYRIRHLNEDIGLSNCITYTSLHSYTSKSCKECKYMSQCINTQKHIYPNIYRNRKIEHDESKTTTG